ncbi:MAG: hypothetical protein V4608_01810 [Bacteroidota bacterium]
MEYNVKNKEELKGRISFTFKQNSSFEDFCVDNFDHYDRDRFEAIAIRMFYGKEIVVTLYALDKSRQEGTSFNVNKLPVKKFKTTTLSLTQILPYIEEFNFTLTAGNYSIDDMEVINK